MYRNTHPTHLSKLSTPAPCDLITRPSASKPPPVCDRLQLKEAGDNGEYKPKTQ